MLTHGNLVYNSQQKGDSKVFDYRIPASGKILHGRKKILKLWEHLIFWLVQFNLKFELKSSLILPHALYFSSQVTYFSKKVVSNDRYLFCLTELIINSFVF